MSLLGAFSYILFFPQIVFFVYDWWVYFTTGVLALWATETEETYLVAAGLFYAIAVSIKIAEADRFQKGKIW